MVFHTLSNERVFARDDVDEHGFSPAVGAYHGKMLIVFQFEIHGFCHPPFRMPCYPLFNPDGFLHKYDVV